MRYLVATDSVHTTAAACGYLGDRLDPDDAVSVLTVTGSDPRTGEDALNVAKARSSAGRPDASSKPPRSRSSSFRCRCDGEI